MQKSQIDETHIRQIVSFLKKTYPDSKIALTYANPWELLVSVILSAQCTDSMVNTVTRKLFSKYSTLEQYVNADLHVFEQDIKSTGFYHNKAKNVLSAAKLIKEKFGGEVPRTMDELLILPGVARKTDADPSKIEQHLMRVIPKSNWFTLTYELIDHGRAICKAQNLTCAHCPLQSFCPSSRTE